ncbi:MAG: tetratricopeptide repeat protein [Steroidobacteraceae bacterium]
MQRAVVAVSGLPEPEAQPTTRAPTFWSTRRNVLIAGSSLAVATIGGAWIAWREGVFGERIADNSVAVLPFANLSGDPNQNYFSDGLAAEVRAALARNNKLRVMAQVSSDAFRDSKDDAVTIARKLGVAVLLDGSVRLHGAAFRIAAELIDGRTGFSRWAQTFDRPIDNIFAVQSEIAGAVVSALAATAAAEGGTDDAAIGTKALSGGTTNVAAYDAYLRGRALYNLDEGESSDRAALAQFDAAIAADPKFASAYAARARSLTVIANQYADAQSIPKLYDAAVQSAETAAALAPDLADAHSTLGFVLYQGRLDIKAARKPFDLSRQLGAGDATVMARFALYCAATGRTAESSQAIGRALELDPLNPLIHRAAATVAYEARRFVDAIPPIRQALALNPKLANAHALMGNALYMLGRYDEARDAFRAETHDMGRLTGLAIVEKKLGDEAAAQAAMKRLVADLGDTALYQQAQVLAQWGDRAAAMTALERARVLGDSGLVYARADPLLDPLRPVPGFLQLLRLLGFD